MNHVKTPDCNFRLGPPVGMTEEQVATLHCRRTENGFTSYWAPTDIERSIIASGGLVVFNAMSNAHPPITLTATPSYKPDAPASDPDGFLERAKRHATGTGSDGSPFTYEDLVALIRMAEGSAAKLGEVGTPNDPDGQALDGASRIAAERRRQQDSEGWTAEHDDAHTGGELRDAAVCYASVPYSPCDDKADHGDTWPWTEEWWKPSEDPVRNLVRSGGLIAAEIDRLLRMHPYWRAELERVCTRQGCSMALMTSRLGAFDTLLSQNFTPQQCYIAALQILHVQHRDDLTSDETKGGNEA